MCRASEHEDEVAVSTNAESLRKIFVVVGLESCVDVRIAVVHRGQDWTSSSSIRLMGFENYAQVADVERRERDSIRLEVERTIRVLKFLKHNADL